MVVDPLAPSFEIVGATLVRYRAQGSDRNFVVLWDIYVTNLAGFGVFVSKADVAPFARDRNVAETVQYLHYFTAGERSPGHSSPEEFR